ncbi:ScbR family autoregulator-binding transcription factor [Streptomyces capitiformicae]|uniref:Gamma-butyrolactone-binding protein n=1 Tax=Streptomyces capitiformicae TaxID=2014920 RepID=A0A919DLR2_9ACTN|nr:ScbR family autoregulator-binding transcription factor [Streptomyces capitiformicae]GHE57408.1 gamma-butyrolactone-binding protein [Streptomyces capitiformicae]
MVGRVIKQERAARTRVALLHAAAEVFAESGFAGANVSNIAERAGLTLGALYFHFRNKSDIAREIVLNQPDLVLPPHPSQGLQHAVDITLTWAYQLIDDPVLLAGARLVMEQEHFVEAEENSHQQWTRILGQDLREAQQRRELRAGVDVEALARLVVNACTGAQMHSHLETKRRDLPYRIEEMWRCLLPAIAVPSVIKRLEFGESRARKA